MCAAGLHDAPALTYSFKRVRPRPLRTHVLSRGQTEAPLKVCRADCRIGRQRVNMDSFEPEVIASRQCLHTLPEVLRVSVPADQKLAVQSHHRLLSSCEAVETLLRIKAQGCLHIVVEAARDSLFDSLNLQIGHRLCAPSSAISG